MAYCVDEAVGYLGDIVVAEIDRVTAGSNDPGERQRKASAVLDKYFSVDKKPQKGQFADPALLFSQQ